jgi:hypothetical protein
VRHEYRIGDATAPGVTELVSIYGADTYEQDEYTELAIDAAAERGTILHAYIAHLLNGGAADEYEIPSAYAGHAEAVDAFLREHSLTPYCVEQAMWGELDGQLYAGTPDFVGEFDGAMAILDYKFVASLAKTKVAAQLAGYDALCLYNGIAVDRRIAVQFKGDGTYRLYPAGNQGAEDFKLALAVWRAKNKKHPRGGLA